MTTQITKTWFDGEKVVTQEIPESDFWALFDENQRLRAELKFNTTPPQQWVELTYEEMEGLYESATYMDKTDCIHLLTLAADKLREKNT